MRTPASDTPSRIPAVQRWQDLARSLLAQANVEIESIVNRCFGLFFEYLYPLTPLVHERSLRDGLAFFISQVRGPTSDTVPPIGDVWPDSTFTLITAVCAEASFMLPKDIFPGGETVGHIFLQASRNCLNSYLEADLEAPNANSITIRYFHSNCIHASGKPKYSWHIFGEATRLAQVMQLHNESALEGLYPLEAELRRRAFWIVYMGDKSAAILNNRPITIHKFSFESGITTAYPIGEEEASLGPSPNSSATSPGTSRKSFIDGFNANLRLWQAASDLLLEVRLQEDAYRADSGTGPPRTVPRQLTSEQRRRLDSLYVSFITCLDDLPPYLQSFAFPAATDQEATQSSQFIIQCANLQISMHCLKMVIAQKFDDMSYLGISAEQADLRRTEIARDMLRVMQEAPFWSLQVNGEPFVRAP